MYLKTPFNAAFGEALRRSFAYPGVVIHIIIGRYDYMKYPLTLCAILLTMIFTAIADAKPVDIEKEPAEHQQIDPEKENTTDDTLGRKYIMGITGSFGGTYPGGTVAGVGDQKRSIGMAYTAGAHFGFKTWDTGAIMSAVEYARKTLVLERSYMGLPMTNTFELSFVEILAGYRHFMDMIYIETGIFYAVKTGDWTEHKKVGKISTRSTIDERSGKNEMGIYLGAGVAYPVWNNIAIETGLRVDASFLNAYAGNGDKLRSNTAMIRAGVSYTTAL